MQKNTKTVPLNSNIIQSRHKPCPVLETLPRTQKRDLKDTPYIFVAAIDFGTTYSGYAFSTLLEYKKSPLTINTPSWKTDSGEMTSLKTSSSILFKPDETFHSFGFEAEDKYAELTDEQKHHDWYFFRRFKMVLYKQKEIARTMRLTSVNNKSMLAMKVFSEAIKYMKDHLFKACEKKKAEIIMSDIRWVLTMPVIWSDRAKQFMRESAKQAGIPNNQLVMSLEAEAASLFCKYLPVSEMSSGKEGDNVAVFKPGTRYMVVDVGGGTVDITVHEIQDDMKLKEVYMAKGGDWGGTMVDNQFEVLLSEILGEEVFKKFKIDHVADYLDLQRTFETKKRLISDPKDSKITFTLPISLKKTFEIENPGLSIEKKAGEHKQFANNLTWKADKLRIKSTLAQTIFAESVEKIVQHVDDLLQKPEVKEIQAILLVGGYAECVFLQKEVSSRFPEKRLIIPQDAGLAVLKGAVINGHELEAISERISRFTYGVKMSTFFNELIHPLHYRFYNTLGVPFCANIFSPHVKKGTAVKVGKMMEPHRYNVVNPNQTAMTLPVYISTEPDPAFVTDEGCDLVGPLVVKMPDTRRGMDRGVDVFFTFGGAEIEVKVCDSNTKDEHFAYFDFLSIQSSTDD